MKSSNHRLFYIHRYVNPLTMHAARPDYQRIFSKNTLIQFNLAFFNRLDSNMCIFVSTNKQQARLTKKIILCFDITISGKTKIPSHIAQLACEQEIFIFLGKNPFTTRATKYDAQ